MGGRALTYCGQEFFTRHNRITHSHLVIAKFGAIKCAGEPLISALFQLSIRLEDMIQILGEASCWRGSSKRYLDAEPS